jgi:hypothetical protein
VDLGRAGGRTFEEVRDQLRANLIDGAYLVGAMVTEIGRLQQKFFPYIFVPKLF